MHIRLLARRFAIYQRVSRPSYPVSPRLMIFQVRKAWCPSSNV
jgi:hypothetical protein